MDKIHFAVNGTQVYISGSDVSATTSLNDYLRTNLYLFGTKAMCHEGGCGLCVVAASKTHPITKEKSVFAINSLLALLAFNADPTRSIRKVAALLGVSIWKAWSVLQSDVRHATLSTTHRFKCLVHVLSCHQWDITTVSGVGNQNKGYNTIQSRLARFNGTQCGFCTPGMVMNMYSLYEGSKRSVTMRQVERSFGGNICRCTGYRPILDAFKTFSSDANEDLKKTLRDMEELDKLRCLRSCVKPTFSKRYTVEFDRDWCLLNDNKPTLELALKSGKWFKAFKVHEVFKILAKEGLHSYRLVSGNTGKGIYPIEEEPKVLIDISSIDELNECILEEYLMVGGGTNLTDMISEFRETASRFEDFQYLTHFENHLERVAHMSVRNIGTLAGNLALKNAHKEFPSDIFLLLETVEATVTIMDCDLQKTDMTMKDFLNFDLKNHLIYNVKLPSLLGHNYLLKTYKIMPRAQNAHAIVNAGFLFKVQSHKKAVIVTQANIVYGNIASDFIRAEATENFLKGQELFNNATLIQALLSLDEEIMPVVIPAEPSPLCRKTIALGLFYKAILSLAPKVSDRFKSGGKMIERVISSGQQTFTTDETLWPLNEPVQKLAALRQCGGEVKYSCDAAVEPRELFVAFVTSTICIGEIDQIDASRVLKIRGVVSFYTAKDIPGKNSFTPTEVPWIQFDEEILASTFISYNGQPIGLVAATSQKLAWSAAKMVKVTYKTSGVHPVLCARDALKSPDKDERLRGDAKLEPTETGNDIAFTFKGSYYVPSQFHYSMERQCARVVCGDYITVTSSTQWPDLVHVAVAKALNVSENKVEVKVPRVGGAYGGKASRSALTAVAAAIVAQTQAVPVTMVLSLTEEMNVVGKRQACDVDYEVSVDSSGLIQSLEITYYSDCGCNYNDSSASEILGTLTNLYESKRWKVTGYSVKTDKASNTWCRAPGTTEGTAIAEHIMERIAHICDKDPIEVRLLNLSPKHTTVPDMITTFKTDSKYAESKIEIEKFNNGNAWKKRGISISIMSYPIEFSGNFAVTISVYHYDGTIVIGHGGIEMGQGIHTKVAQVCAYKLNVSLEKVSVRGFHSFVTPNAMASSSSITSESVAFACLKACDILLDRLKEVKDEMNEPTWEELVKAAYDKGINLQSSYMMSERDELEGYNVYGICSSMVELDCLIGSFNCTKVYILEDTGVSLSPEIDVGQIEGAFVMGLGLWTSEHLEYDRLTGRILTDRTWTYKPPGSNDIPEHFSVAFMRNSVNNAGVLRSKATGEPALTLSVVVTQALHKAILEARKEHGYKNQEWVHVDTPYNAQNILKAISPKLESYKILEANFHSSLSIRSLISNA